MVRVYSAIARKPSLARNLLIQGVSCQSRGGVDAKFFHQAILVEFNRPDRNAQELRNLLHRFSFSHQLQYFSLARRQAAAEALGKLTRGLELPDPDLRC